MTKFLHIADLHIGRHFQALGYKAEKRKGQGLTLLRKICNYANENLIDIILIAGDFIEASEIRDSFVDEIINILSKCKSKIFIACGNHDFNSIGSYYQEKIWPENVYIFSDNLEDIYLKDLNTRVYGASFNKTYQRESFMKDFKVKSANEINLMVMHADITNSSQSNLYNPISIKEIENSGLDYLALGHIHKSYGIQKIGKTRYAYTGAVFSNSFNEAGQRTFIEGQMVNNILDIKEISLKCPLLILENFDISEIDSEDGLEKLIRDRIENKYEAYEDNFYKIILQGRRKNQYVIDKDILEAKFEDYEYVQLDDQSQLEIDFENIRRKNSISGFFVDHMMKKIENSTSVDERELYYRAMKLGFEVLGFNDNEN